MLTPFSQVETALRDTLLTKATGEAFDRIARFLGFPRVGVLQRKFWRRALRSIGYGPRGTFGTTHQVLEAIFEQYATSRTVSLDPAFPQRLSRVSGPVFTCKDARHFIRLKPASIAVGIGPGGGAGRLYWVREVVSGDEVTLESIPTAYWSRADFSDVGGIVEVEALTLPFWYEEPTLGSVDTFGIVFIETSTFPTGIANPHACKFRVHLDGDIFRVPPTYLLPDGTFDRPVGAPGQPYGGHLIDQFDDDPATPSAGNQTIGPFPLYLPGEDAGGLLSEVIDALLAAGVRVEFVLDVECE